MIRNEGDEPLPTTPIRLERLDSFDDSRELWGDLARRSGSIFATLEWIETWWLHFGKDRALQLNACRDPAGDVFAILPLYSWSVRPLRVLRFLGNGPGDELGPIAAGSDRPAAQQALRMLLDTVDWNVFLGEHLPGDEAWSRILGARTLSRTGSPLLRFEGRTWDELLAARSANFRQQVRRRERALAKAHDVRFRLAADPARLSEDLDVLFALHSERWSDRSSFAGPAQRFHRDFAGRALANGWLRLWFLELDGEPAAVWYGFRFAGVESYYQAGWSPRWASASVGSVLLAHTIREAVADGMHEYRFLQGDESYKHRFAEEDRGLETIVHSRGIMGVTAVGLGLAVHRLGRGRTSLASRLGFD